MLPFSDACERNKDPILNVLRSSFAHSSDVFEIGSGTGQHAVHFAAALPHLIWYPTEQLAQLPDLAMRIETYGTPNIARPAPLDVRQKVWPVESVAAVFTANTLHIMAWAAVQDMFAGIGRVLQAVGTLCIYGPFLYSATNTSASNHAFNEMLQERDPESGLRNIEQIAAEANKSGLQIMQDYEMPACNRCLVLQKTR